MRQYIKETKKAQKYLNLNSQDYNYIFNHLLRSPLYNINSLISWFEEDHQEYLDSVNLYKLKLMKSSIEKLNFLISDITDFLNIEENIKNKYPIDLNNITNKVLSKLDYSLKIKIVILHKLPTVFANKLAMESLFKNLFMNSIMNIKNNFGEITIDYTEDKNSYKFTYIENWNLIDFKYDDLFVIKSDYKPSNNHHLSIVTKIIESNHGKIKFYKTPKIGFKAVFTIPKF